MDKADEAARAVAALLDLAAVGVPDAVSGVCVGSPRFLDQENLIAADAEMSVREPLRSLRGDFNRGADAVQDNEVVARSLHLGEFETQLRACTRDWLR